MGIYRGIRYIHAGEKDRTFAIISFETGLLYACKMMLIYERHSSKWYWAIIRRDRSVSNKPRDTPRYR